MYKCTNKCTYYCTYYVAHTSLSLTGASALLAWSILGMGDLGSSLGSGRRMRSLEGLKEEEKEEEEEVKCKDKDEIR
jgi:hypothetical protein